MSNSSNKNSGSSGGNNSNNSNSNQNNTSSNNNNSNTTIAGRETILFEYLPFVYFNVVAGSSSTSNGISGIVGNDQAKPRGVLMIVMLNGDVSFYPIETNELNLLPSKLSASTNDKENDNSNSNNNNTNTDDKKDSNGNGDGIGQSSSNKNKYSKYNISLSLTNDHKVYNFNFIDNNPTFLYTLKQQSISSSPSASSSSSPPAPSSPTPPPSSSTPPSSSKNKKKSKETVKQPSSSSSTATSTPPSSSPTSPLPQQQQQQIEPLLYKRPRKILLSHDKRLLLIIGCYYKGIKCLTVYKIHEEGPDYFQLIYYDSSFTFIDACFSSDSQMLACILSRFPNYIFFLQLPHVSPNKKLANDAIKLHQQITGQQSTNVSNTSSTSTPQQQQQQQQKAYLSHMTFNSFITSQSSVHNSKLISYEPRKVGPLAIIGPAKNALSLPYSFTHIASNPAPYGKNPKTADKIEYYEYVTWNDEGLGEYCFWNMNKESSSQRQYPTLRYEWMTRLIGPIVPDKVWIEKENSPKHYIINMEFSPRGDLVMVIVRQENHGSGKNKQLNGIGMQTISSNIRLLNDLTMASCSGPQQQLSPSLADNAIIAESFTPWCQIMTPDLMNAQACLLSEVVFKWTESLFFGSTIVPSMLVRGVGIHEMVAKNICAVFTNGADDPNSCSNYIQLGRYHRLLVGSTNNIYLITLTPKHSDPIDWRRVLEQKDQVQFTKSLKMIGYNIMDNLQISQQLQQQNQQQTSNTNQQNIGKIGGLSSITNSSNVNTSKQSLQNKKVEDILAMIESKDPALSTIAERVGRGEGETYLGIQLYRCWQCKQTLIKPLICSGCKLVVYCSKHCQKESWKYHKDICQNPTPPPNPPSLQSYYIG